MRVDHIGYAVKQIGKTKKSMEALGFRFGETIEDTAAYLSVSASLTDIRWSWWRRWERALRRLLFRTSAWYFCTRFPPD